ncbi:MAG TPA: hypothetical protein VK174_04115, partial [Chitinophagales bacterium]|nr:hypothetical protein [Chitinophagales bacterium]
NEYRLLYEFLLKQIIARQSLDKEVDTAELLSYLLTINAYELFEDEYNAMWQKAIKQDDIDLLVRLSDLNLTYYLTGKSQSIANAEYLSKLSQQRLSLLQVQFLRNIRKEEIRLKLAERVVSAYKKVVDASTPLNSINLAVLEKNDLYAQYLSMRAQINFAFGEQKIKLLKAIIADEELIKKYEPSAEEALCRFLINLAQEYYLNLNFKDSLVYYKKAYTYFNNVPVSVREVLMINYIMSLMRNGEFDIARQLATANAGLMLNSKVLASRSSFLLAMLNLYARNADAAEQYVKLDSKKDGSEFYYFMRLVLSAAYYLRGDIDLAEREAINLDQAVNYELNRDKNFQTQISKPIISTFRKFYSIVQSRRISIKKELKKLHSEISGSQNSKSDQSPNSLLVEWLVEQIRAKCYD